MILFFIFLLSFLSSIYSHVFIIPYPYYNREYAIKLTRNIKTNQISFSNNFNSYSCEKNWEVVCDGVFFYRFADRAYDGINKNKYLSAAFHGRSHFELSDLSPHNKIISIDNTNRLYKNAFKDHQIIRYEGFVSPEYLFREYGVNCAFDFVKIIYSDLVFLLQLRLPIVNRVVDHQNRWNDIQYDKNILSDDRLYFDDLNRYFKVRVDYLYEKGLLEETRSNSDFDKARGITFSQENYSNYFLEKPFFSKDNNKVNQDNVAPEKITIDTRSVDKSSWYAMTEFNENALPVKKSLLFYHDLKNTIDMIDSNKLNAITRGEFLGKNYDWSSINNNYIAPLDIQFNITKLFLRDNLILQGLFALVIPMKNTAFLGDNYIQSSFLKDQFAMRIGSQFSYDINQYYKMVFYGSWQYFFPTNQIIPAIFENVSAYGLAPLYLRGKVSWDELYLAAHLVIKYNEQAGIDLGYQYINKSGDNVIPECQNFYLINGEQYQLDYTQWKNFTENVANICNINFYYYYKYLQLDMGFKSVLAGKNLMKLNEYMMRIGIDF